jgi:hypothetical protein
MKCLLVFILALTSIVGLSQQNLPVLIPFLADQKYGFADETGKPVISPAFELAYPFFGSHELSFVVLKAKPYLINRKGKRIMDAVPDYLPDSLNLTMEGIYNSMPEKVSTDIYSLDGPAARFVVFTHPAGKHLFDKLGLFYLVRISKKVYLTDVKGKLQTSGYDRIRHIVAGEIEYALTEDYTTKKTGLLDGDGKLLLECVYDGISYQGKGIFELTQSGKTYQYKAKYNQFYKPADMPVKEPDKNRIISRRDRKFGIADSLKNILLPYVYDRLYPMGQDIYLFRKQDSLGIMSLTGGIIFSMKAKLDEEQVSGNKSFVPFVAYTNRLAFINGGDEWKLVSTDGEIILEGLEYVDIDFQKYAGHIAAVGLNNKTGLINNQGKMLLPVRYDKIFALPCTRTFVVEQNGKYSWVAGENEKIYADFDDFRYVLPAYLLVRKNDAWYFVNRNGLEFKK